MGGIAGKSMLLRLADRGHNWDRFIVCSLALFCFLIGDGGETTGQDKCLISCDSELPDSLRDLEISPWRSDERLSWRLWIWKSSEMRRAVM